MIKRKQPIFAALGLLCALGLNTVAAANPLPLPQMAYVSPPQIEVQIPLTPEDMAQRACFTMGACAAIVLIGNVSPDLATKTITITTTSTSPVNVVIALSGNLSPASTYISQSKAACQITSSQSCSVTFNWIVSGFIGNVLLTATFSDPTNGVGVTTQQIPISTIG